MMVKAKYALIGIGIAVLLLLAGFAVTGYFLEDHESIPASATGEMRAMYEWAKTPEGAALLEQMPCYCGCAYEGHRHARHCFWRDDGTFDKHGTTCAVCFDIAKRTKQMHEENKSICEIRYAIDQFYASNAHLATGTPLPEGCTAYVPTGNETELPEGCGNDSLSCSL